MTDAELEDQLRNKRAVVVHFSHHSVINPHRPLFPGDLAQAIANRDKFTLSCSVVWPNHPMDLVGSVGVIFKPRCANVISVSNSDSGSMSMADGSDGSLGVPLTDQSFASTFQPVGKYNEWRVQGAEVAGIFVANVNSILTKRTVEFDVMGVKQTAVSAEATRLADIFDAFPAQQFFTMSINGLREIFRS